MFKKKPADNGKDTANPEIRTTTDGQGKEHNDVDVNAWKEEFKFSPEEIAERGPAVGFMRFVAFEKDDNLRMMSDLRGNEQFAQAFVEVLAKNDETFEYLKALVNRADRLRKIKDMDFGDMMGGIFGNRFAPGGRSFGELDELRELLGVPQRRKNPLRELAEFMEGRKTRRGPGIEVHVMGIGGRSEGSSLDTLLEALREGGPEAMAALARKMSGGEGCDCPECRAEQERVAKSKAESVGADENKPAEASDEKREE